MSRYCSHCGGPLSGPGIPGRNSVYCCYGCLSLGESPRESLLPRSLGLRLGIGLLVIGQSMIFGLALNLHDDVPTNVRWATQTAILLATLVVVALLGGPLVAVVCRELRRGNLTIEALFLLTMGGAMAASLQAHFTGQGAVYFEVVSVLLVVYTLGKAIGARSRATALAAARAWSDRLATCRVVSDANEVRSVPVVEVRAGDCVEVNPGEAIAVDGIIREGSGFVNEAAVNGEPFATVRRPGDTVLAGAIAHDSGFRIVASVAGTDRQIDRLLAAVEAARTTPTSMQARADALGRIFLPLVLAVALGTFGYWSFLTPRGWETGLFHAMSVLLVACPCVIGLATPIILWTALNRLAERGLIARSGDVIERLAEIDRVVFDKTGTLTDDRLAIMDIDTVAAGADRTRVLGWLAAVERRCSHPVARAFASLPVSHEVRVHEIHTIPGCGVIAEIEDGDRHEVRIGRVEWIASAVPKRHTDSTIASDSGLHARVDVAIDGEFAATVLLAERVRDSTTNVLAELRAMKLPVEVLTGDSAERASILNVSGTRSRLLPDEKRQHIEALRSQGHKPLMVGDGINDASALAAAHVGVAMSSGTDLAVGASDIAMYHGDLGVLPWAIALSRETVKAVRRSLLRALAYNLVGMALAAAGLLHPIAAALLMVISSLTLIFSATRVGLHCQRSDADAEPRAVGAKAWVHGVAFAIQGVFLAELLGTSLLLALPFAVGGAVLGLAWHRRPTLPHALDMVVGMLTLGNLGMILGWWADLGFVAVRCAHCCSCTEPLAKPWMWLGMLSFANVAMLTLGRQPGSVTRDHAIAMYTGGNLGMIVGMILGGQAASAFTLSDPALQATLHLLGMTVGMIGGMLTGTWLVENLKLALPTDSRKAAFATKS